MSIKVTSQCHILDQNREEIERLYHKEGWSMSQIQKRFKIKTRNIVAGWLSRRGISRTATATSKSDDQVNIPDIINRYVNNETLKNIAEFYQTTTHHVKRILISQNIAIRSRAEINQIKGNKRRKNKIIEKIEKRHKNQKTIVYGQPTQKIYVKSENPKKERYKEKPFDIEDFYASDDGLPKAGYCKYPVGKDKYIWCKKKATHGGSPTEGKPSWCEYHYALTHDKHAKIGVFKLPPLNGFKNNKFLD